MADYNKSLQEYKIQAARTKAQEIETRLIADQENEERLGINFRNELNALIVELNQSVAHVDFLSLINNDEDKKNDTVENTIRPYEIEMLRIVAQIEDDIKSFSDDMFQTLRAGLLIHFEENEDYEKCDKLIKLTFNDVGDFYVPPYVVKNNIFFNRRRKRRR